MQKSFKIAVGVAALAISAIQAEAQQGVFLGSQGNLSTLVTSQGNLYTSDDEISGKLNQGWWSPTTINIPDNDNYFTGTYVGAQYNDYFIFDLSLLSGPITSATLVLQDDMSPDSGTPPYNLTLWDVSTPIATLNNTTGSSAAIYNDLGSGVEYGSASFGGYPNEAFITLDAAALAAINAQGSGYFAIGGTLSPSASVPDGGATLSLLGMGVASLLALRRKM
jgi:hypothetical protein